MKHLCITISKHEISELGYQKLVTSSKRVKNDFEIEKYEAVLPDEVEKTSKDYNIKWTYPWQGESIDFASGLTLRSYPTAIKNVRVACFLSHYGIWKQVDESKEPALVFEHDAEFVKKLNYDFILDSKYDIIGINNPLGATRKSKEYHDAIQRGAKIQPVPRIDNFNIPQGLAGNSAYIIKPRGAKALLDATKTHGMWPNDALMCYQLIDNLGVTRDFYTKVQGLPSTTTR
tara:strand:- start:120 stop:812 length:693 start_codon:yes stop_codon:yes gene_type:complete